MPPEIRVSAKLRSLMSLRLGSDTLDVHWLNAPGLNSLLSPNSKRQLCFTFSVIAHRLKFYCFCFEFTSFTGSSPLFWAGVFFFFFLVILSLLTSLSACRRHGCLCCSFLDNLPHPATFWRVRGEQLDLTGQRKWAPPFSRGEAMEPSIRNWPPRCTGLAPARVSHGSAWDRLLIKACCP